MRKLSLGLTLIALVSVWGGVVATTRSSGQSSSWEPISPAWGQVIATYVKRSGDSMSGPLRMSQSADVIFNQAATNAPQFGIGSDYVAGIGLNALSFWYQDGVTAKSLIGSWEQSGTFAVVNDGVRRSMVEGYRTGNNGLGAGTGGPVDPDFRLSAYGNGGTNTMTLELGPGGSVVASGNASCAANVLSFNTGSQVHGMSVGDIINIVSGDSHIPQDETSTLTVATAVDATHLTVAKTCTTGTSTSTVWISGNTDFKIRRIASQTLAFVAGPSSNEAHTPLIMYPTALSVQAGTSFQTNGGWITPGTTVTHAQTPYTVGEAGDYLCDASGGAVNFLLPAANAQSGRRYVFSTKFGGNGTCNIVAAGADLIGGTQATWGFGGLYGSVVIRNDGVSNWDVLASEGLHTAGQTFNADFVVNGFSKDFGGGHLCNSTNGCRYVNIGGNGNATNGVAIDAIPAVTTDPLLTWSNNGVLQGKVNSTGNVFAGPTLDPIPSIHAANLAVAQSMEVGAQALTAGAATVTFATAFGAAPKCFCQDAANTATLVTRCNATTTVLTLAGTGTDSIAYFCLGQK